MYSQYCTKPFFQKPRTYNGLIHSAKDSTWKKHKYIKRIDGTYYYPDSYAGGRHLPDGEEKELSEDEQKALDQKSRTKAFDEFESFAKELVAKGEAYWDDEEVKNMSKEDLAELYENFTGVKLGDRDMERLYRAKQTKYNPEEEGNEPMLSSGDIDALAQEVIKGKFGAGKTRKDLLAENYEDVQKRVNELQKAASNKKVSSVSQEDMNALDNAIQNADSKKKSSSSSKKSANKGLDVDKIMSVYAQQERRIKGKNWTK